MPMFLFRRNVHDIAHANDLLARFGGDDTLARGDKQHLVAAMSVHFVSGTRTEVDDGKVDIRACLSDIVPSKLGTRISPSLLRRSLRVSNARPRRVVGGQFWVLSG